MKASHPFPLPRWRRYGALALLAAGCWFTLAPAQTLFGGDSPAGSSPTPTPTPTPTPPPLPTTALTLDQIIPADTEILISVNIREVIDAGLLDQLTTVAGKQQELKAQMHIIEQMFGSNPLRDLQRVHVFGRVNDDKNIGLIAEGNFDRARLLGLVQTNAQFRELPTPVAPTYQWFDGKDKVLKFGAFLNEHTVVVWNSEAVYHSSLAAAQDAAQRLDTAKVLALLPPSPGELTGWATLITRRETCPGAKLQVASAVALADAQAGKLKVELHVKGNTPEADRQWRDLLTGVLAFGQLQRENAEIANLAGAAHVDEGPHGGARLSLVLDPAATLAKLKGQP